MISSICIPSNRVHEGALDAAELDQADEEDQQADGPAEQVVAQIEVAEAEHAAAEGRDDRRDGVQHVKPQPLFRNQPQAVGDRAAVLPELEPKAHQHGKVAVLRGHGGDDDAAARGEDDHLQDAQWDQKEHRRDLNARPAADDEVQPEAQEHHKLYAEGDQPGKRGRNRRNQPGIVNLAHRRAVFEESV